MIQPRLIVEMTSADDDAASQWSFAGKVDLASSSTGSHYRDITGWATTVTREEAQAEQGLEAMDPGMWEGTDEPLTRRATRVAELRVAELFVAAMIAAA